MMSLAIWEAVSVERLMVGAGGIFVDDFEDDLGVEGVGVGQEIELGSKFCSI